MDVQFGMSPADVEEAATPGEFAQPFKPPSVLNDHGRVQQLFPPMTPLVMPASVHSIPTFIPQTPAPDPNVPVPQLQNIVSTVNLGAFLFLHICALKLLLPNLF